jgi:putative membrane protein insertion efficiency factor
MRTWPRRVLVALVRGYRLLLSPWLGPHCRFEPTCSGYALAALELHGAAAGSYLAARRLLRCHPWCAGGLDPVPGRAPRLSFARHGLRRRLRLRSADDAVAACRFPPFRTPPSP